MKRRDDELKSERESRRERRMRTKKEEEEDREYEMNNIRIMMEYQKNIIKFNRLILSILTIFYLRPFADRMQNKRSGNETRSVRSFSKKSQRSSDARSRASIRSNSTYDSMKSLTKLSVKV
jgi:hypothetical protein